MAEAAASPPGLGAVARRDRSHDADSGSVARSGRSCPSLAARAGDAGAILSVLVSVIAEADAFLASRAC